MSSAMPGTPPTARKVRVLIVDDSAVMRELLRRILSRDPDIEVVGSAPDPIAAEARIPLDRPDVLTLDVDMPRMDGLTFLERLMATNPLPVVMVSALTQRGCETAMRALELGAVDVLAKPKFDIEHGTKAMAADIVAVVKAAGAARPRRGVLSRPAAPAVRPPSSASTPRPVATARPSIPVPAADAGSRHVVAIGASTGGTEALLEVLQHLPEDTPGTVIVQHMPAGFTKAFASRLDRSCKVRVKEAEHGDPVVRGTVLIAPGDRHMTVEREGGRFVVHLNDGPPVGYHKPAVDVLFDSVAARVGASAVGVILTGMGADGAAGLVAMRRAGAHTVAQDEATSVVYGMPREAAARGGAESVEPLHQIAGTITRWVAELRRGGGRQAA
jgi:two-component system, chemotaxis family, protein-glutamate methylesterase/glutaminase